MTGILRRAAIALLALGLASLAGLGLLFLRGAPPEPRPETSGTALVGGPFSLLDHWGERVTDEDFRGRYLLVYFGYTFCPDVCPLELETMSAALDLLDARGAEVTPLFVTIDPARDTVPVMRDYVAHFHPRMVGLTGTAAEIAEAAKAYRVYYAKVEDDADVDAPYLMDHSSIVYLMGPDGRYLAHFTALTSPKEMAAGIAAHL